MGLWRGLASEWRKRPLRRWVRSQTLLERPCPLCGSTRYTPLQTGDRDFLGIHTAQCGTCGFIYSNPFFAPDAMEAFYSRLYRSSFKGEARPELFARRHVYLRQRANYYACLLSTQRALPPSAGMVADLGCGEGSLLGALHATRSDLYMEGVEPEQVYREYVERTLGLPVRPDVRGLLGSPRFSLVTTIHVLEHLWDPVGFLREAAQILKPGGFLFVDVPDVTGYMGLQDLHLAHCSHFSNHTLGFALELAGLTVMTVTAHQPPTLPPSIYAVARTQTEGERAPAVRVFLDPDATRTAAAVRSLDISRLGWFVSRVWRHVRR